ARQRLRRRPRRLLAGRAGGHAPVLVGRGRGAGGQQHHHEARTPRKPPSPPLRGRGVGGEGALSLPGIQPPPPQPLSPARGEGRSRPLPHAKPVHVRVPPAWSPGGRPRSSDTPTSRRPS